MRARVEKVDVLGWNKSTSTSQEYNLSGKEASEIWAATFGVKINRYNAENGIFAEQLSRSEI